MIFRLQGCLLEPVYTEKKVEGWTLVRVTRYLFIQ